MTSFYYLFIEYRNDFEMCIRDRLGLFSAWLTDSLAYFAGRFFGKHKMAPNISPCLLYTSRCV